MPCESCQWCHIGFAKDTDLGILPSSFPSLGQRAWGSPSGTARPWLVGPAKEEQSRLLHTCLHFILWVLSLFPLGSFGMCWELGWETGEHQDDYNRSSLAVTRCISWSHLPPSQASFKAVTS